MSHGWLGEEPGFTSRVVPHSTAIVGPPNQGTTATLAPSTLTIVSVLVVFPQLVTEIARMPVATRREANPKGAWNIARIFAFAVSFGTFLVQARVRKCT
jgi:hypothetical protein